jgi:hypothetical protein
MLIVLNADVKSENEENNAHPVEGQAERTESTEKYDPETTERWKQSTAD